MSGKVRESVASRFMKKVWPEPNSGCWLWDASTGPKGYGQFRMIDGTVKRAHRLSYEWHVGPIPTGMCVCHKCDVPTCVNPDHLFLGAQAENMADMRRKGRGSKWPGKRGEASSSSKLTEHEVQKIRSSKLKGIELAKMFGVSTTNISAIKSRKIWRHI
jgi:hypothetical protein